MTTPRPRGRPAIGQRPKKFFRADPDVEAALDAIGGNQSKAINEALRKALVTS